jgi:hypothetical protein
MAESCDHGNESYSSMAGGEFIDELDNDHLIRKDSALCSETRE